MSMRRWASAGGLALLLAASGAIAATTPTRDQWEMPFRESAPLGERGEGRNIAGTVHSARLADAVRDDTWQSGDGSLWLVVDAGMESVSDVGVLAHATVVVGERTFSASERPHADTMRRAGLEPGIATRGVLVFELPADILGDPDAAAAELQLALDLDTRLDSVLVTPIDLTALERSPVDVLVDRRWGRG